MIRADATAHRIQDKGIAPVVGAWIGVRLNLNILRSTGVCVHSLHEGRQDGSGLESGRGFWDGQVLGYAPIVTLRDVWFSVQQRGREAIGLGTSNKHPMASVDGILVGERHRLDGVAVRFNPKFTHLFVDEEGCAVRWAEEVTIMGHRAYLRGRVSYHDADTAPQRPAGAVESLAVLRR